MRRKRKMGTQGDALLMVYVGKVLFRLTFFWGVGTAVTARRDPAGHFVPLTDGFELRRTFVKQRRAGASGVPVSKHLAALESNLFSKLMAIVEHLGVTQYDDGEARKPGWITLKTMGSSWVVEAKDPDSCSKLTVVERTLDDALALLCVLLESDEAPWEPDPWARAQATKASKKK